jgi:mono/diheme cytochrome c family protein
VQPAPVAMPAPGEAVTYRYVAPVFLKRCVKCHTNNGQMGPPPEGLRLASREHGCAFGGVDGALGGGR